MWCHDMKGSVWCHLILWQAGSLRTQECAPHVLRPSSRSSVSWLLAPCCRLDPSDLT